MPYKVVDTAGQSYFEGRHAATLSNGNAINVVQEGLVLKVYETSETNRASGWTLRATWDLAGNLPGATDVLQIYTIALWQDNSISVAVGAASDNVHYFFHRKLTYAGYSWGSVETVLSGTSSTSNWYIGIGNLDIDVTDAGAVIMCMMRSDVSNAGRLIEYIRLYCRSTGGTWGTHNEVFTVDNTGHDGNYPLKLCTIVALSGGSSSARPVVMFSNVIWRASSGINIDNGLQLRTYTVNETTGAVSASTFRGSQVFAMWPSDGHTPPWYARRILKLFKSTANTNEWHLGIMQGNHGGSSYLGMENWFGYARGTFDGTTHTYLQPLTQNTAYNSAGNQAAAGDAVGSQAGTAARGISFGNNSINFLFSCFDLGNNGRRILSAQFHWEPTEEAGVPNVIYVNRGGYWDNGEAHTLSVSSSTSRNTGVNRHDVQIVYSDNKPYHKGADLPGDVTNVTPANATTVETSTPVLTASYASPIYWAQATGRVHWQIATDIGFSTGLKNSYSDWVAVEKTSSNPITLSKTLESALALSGGFWYIRARMEYSTGRAGSYNTPQSFTIGHPPLGIPLSPLNNRSYEYGSGAVTFSWTFTDPAPDDVQTAFQVRVRQTNETGTIIHDSGKVTSANKTYTWTVPSGNKNQILYWEVRLWDSQDAIGNYSTGSSFFEMVDPAYANVTSPTAAQSYTQGNPTVTATVVATGARYVKEYVFRIMKAGKVLWTSNRVYGNWTNGQTLSANVPGNVLITGGQYTIQVVTVDNGNITMISAPVQFSTLWTEPLSPAVFSATTGNYNSDGYVQLSWVDANREAGFNGWAIYRKADIIDPFTQAVVQEGTYELVTIDSRAVAGTYVYYDYFAPSGVKVSYLIKQRVVRSTGFEVESGNTTPATCYPQTDSYWLLDKIGQVPSALKLSQVTADTFNEEQEEAIYVVQGKGRHTDKGQYLGVSGSLAVQIRYNGSVSPRLARQKLLELQKQNESLWLRNPFGDIYKVNVSGMSVSRIAGVGASEFVDVTLPYVEVG